MEHNKQQRIIATHIATELFNNIIEFLRNNEWELIAAYNDLLYDKGIDFDFYQFIKDADEILLAWDNWCEGEMKTSKAISDEITRHLSINFQFKNPAYLHQEDFIDKIRPFLKYY